MVLAHGAEEMEVSISVDVLRRAWCDVTLAGLEGPDPVRCSRGVTIVPDTAMAVCTRDPFDAIVLPGGAKGAEAMAGSPLLGELLRLQNAAGRWIAAICAAPTALLAHGIADGRRMACHPSVEGAVAERGELVRERVCVDGNLVTSQGPGTAFDFALTLVAHLAGPGQAEEVAAQLCLPEDVRWAAPAPE